MDLKNLSKSALAETFTFNLLYPAQTLFGHNAAGRQLSRQELSQIVGMLKDLVNHPIAFTQYYTGILFAKGKRFTFPL